MVKDAGIIDNIAVKMVSGLTKGHVKGSSSIRVLIEILFFALLFFLAIKVYGMFMSLWFQEGYLEGTKKSLEALQVEIDSLTRDQKTVPIYIDKGHKIVGFPHTKPIQCSRGASCLCICDIDSNCQNYAIKTCLTLTIPLQDQFWAEPKIFEGKPITYNCVLMKSGDKVNVSCISISEE